MASMMIGTFSGEGPFPGAERACRPAPQLDDQITEAVDDLGVLREPRRAVDVTDGSQPLRHAVELSELSLERRQDGKAPCGVSI
jgi:hypothetical protein